MADGGECSQEFMVKYGVPGFSIRLLPRVEGKGGPRLLHTLLECSSNMCT